MSKSNLKTKTPEVTAEPIQDLNTQAVATITLSRMSNAQVQFSFGGTDCDLLGLLEFGKSILTERMRTTAIAAGTQRPAVIKLPPESSPTL